MLTAAETLARHPQGCWVFDATGRRLNDVLACDPGTGEVVTLDRQWLCDPCESLSRKPVLYDGIPGVHGFWPAPLRVVPKGGPVPADQAYIVGNGEPEALLE